MAEGTSPDIASPEGLLPSGQSFSERMRYVSTLPEGQRDEAMKRLGLEIRGGATTSEIAQKLEKARAGDPDSALDVSLLIDNMEAEDRESNAAIYKEASEILAEYAHKGKLLGEDPKIAAEERKLKDLDKQELEKDRTPAEQRALQESLGDADVRQPQNILKKQLQNLLDSLDATEEELKRIDNTLGLESTHKELFSEHGWKNLRETQASLRLERQNLRTKIEGSTSSNFLTVRDNKQVEIKNNIEAIKQQLEAKKEENRRDQRLEPEEWEDELENELFVRSFIGDKKPSLREPPENLPAVSEVINFINQQEQLRKTGNPNFSLEAYQRAEEALSWYFYHARNLGIFDDLEERLEQKYLEFANSLYPHREIDQMDYYRGSRGRTVQKNYAEVEDDITDFFDTLLESSKPQYVEHASRWDFLQRRGVNPQDRQRLEGIRAEFVRRARVQIEDSISNLSQQINRKGRMVNINRISGEWDVLKLERQFSETRDKQELESGDRPLFVEESSWKITLLGRNRQEIEQGADQAADAIIRSATTYTLDVIRERMGLLLRAIEERTTDLKNSEHISQSDAQVMVDEIKHTVTNKMDFYTLNFLAGNLLMEPFAGYLEDRIRVAGVEKLRLIPAMNDGLVGLALHFLNDPQFRLYYRPQGFKGQLFDDDTTHKYIRGAIREKIIGLLMEYEFKGLNDRENILENRKKLMSASSLDEFLSNFDHKTVLPEGKKFADLTDQEKYALVQDFNSLSPSLRLDLRRWQYHQILGSVNELKRKKDNNQATDEDLTALAANLENLKIARKFFVIEQNEYQKIRNKAESAFTTADRAMNVFGESADLGGPSIIMDNGDFIRVEDVALFYKYAILQAAKKYGEQYGAQDNMALIRWRSRMWIQKWKGAGLDRNKASRNFSITLKDGRQMDFTLKKGFEETGLTEQEWQAFEEAVKEIRKNGFTAQINGVKFENIIKMDYLQPVINNFVADYKSSESQINNPMVLEEAAKGRLTPIRRILGRLGIGREGIEGNTTQQRIDNLTQMIEDSRALDAELERLAYFEATHGLPPGQDPKLLPFSADRIDYGFQGLPWGIKRLQHLKAFWYANLRRTVPRGVDFVHAMPFSLPRLSKWLSFGHLLEVCWNAQSELASGMESVDNPALTLYANTFKDLVYLRAVSEGGVDLEKGKIWGFLEKPLFDANSLWKLFESIGISDFQAFVEQLNKEETKLTQDTKEKIVDYFQMTTLRRFTPIVVGTEKQLGEDRQAISSGAGYDENEKFALRFLEWLMSEKRATEEHGAREEAGIEAFSEIRDILKLIVTPNSYSKGSSIWDEVWRKLIPSHNIRLPLRVPEPTYRAFAA